MYKSDQKCLGLSVQVYELAVEYAKKYVPHGTDFTVPNPRRGNLLLRLANAKNELGAWYMDQAARRIAETGKDLLENW